MSEKTNAAVTQLISKLPGNILSEEFDRRMAGLAASPMRGSGRSALEHIFPDCTEENYADLATLREIESKKIQKNILNRITSKDRLTALRAEMQSAGIDGFIIPLNDEFHGEAAPAASDRLKWLTGFTGSAGLAAISRDQAAIFVDGRYTLQVQTEVDNKLFTPRHVSDEPLKDWIEQTFVNGQRIGYDSWLHTENSVKNLQKAADEVSAKLVAVTTNPIDAVWQDRPSMPLAPVVPHEDCYSGQSSKDKRQQIASTLKSKNCSHVILTLPDSVAWLLNIRGADLPCTPFALGFAILNDEGQASLFIDETKLSSDMKEHLGADVTVFPRDKFADNLLSLSNTMTMVDPSTTSQWIIDQLTAASTTVVRSEDPCQLPKACKNDVEIEGCKRAHIRDGAAVSRYLHWLSTKAGDGMVDELTAAEKLQSYREELDLFQDLSFPTISGAGSNGAIVHYRASEESCKILDLGSLYLVDSGGQYFDGTTDITRTVAIGKPTDEMRDRFTRVLKGHIALALAKFPEGTTGSQLDVLARRPLWEIGLDYDHGTGHGVGSYLSVHEGPHRISKVGNNVALQPGMIVSNEPGFYKTGAFGIRIENLVTVRKCESLPESDRPMLEFETLKFIQTYFTLYYVSVLGNSCRYT